MTHPVLRYRVVPVFLALFAVLGLPSTANAACDLPVGAEELHGALAAGEAAYGNDVDAFVAAERRVSAAVPCLLQPLTPADAARVHRIVALRAYVERDPPRTVAAFAAARVAEPTYTLPLTLVPEGNPARADYVAVDVSAPKTLAVPPPTSGGLLFDGSPGLARPQAWPTIVQVITPDQSVAASAYVWPGDPLPLYATAATPKPTKNAAGRTLAFVGAGSALAAGGVYLAAFVVATDLRSNAGEMSREEGEVLQDQANGLVLTSAGLGVVALGSGIAAAISLPW